MTKMVHLPLIKISIVIQSSSALFSSISLNEPNDINSSCKDFHVFTAALIYIVATSGLCLCIVYFQMSEV